MFLLKKVLIVITSIKNKSLKKIAKTFVWTKIRNHRVILKITLTYPKNKKENWKVKNEKEKQT